MEKIMIIAGGIINILLGVFHLLFWKLFNWPAVFQCLPAISSAVIVVINTSLALTVFIFGYLSVLHCREMMETNIGRKLVLLIALFYFSRTILGIVFFPIPFPYILIDSVGLVFVGLLYLIPYISIYRRNHSSSGNL